MEEQAIIDIDQIKSVLKRKRPEIRKKYKADIRGIFGSYSRREASVQSDIDILVRFEKGASLFGWAGLVHYLEKVLGISVDVVPESSLKKELHDSVYKDLIEI